MFLASYWQSFPPKDVKAGILADWCDELSDWTHEQIVWTLRKWRAEYPDRRPNPGHIVAMMKDIRGRKIAATMPKIEPPKPEPATKEQAAAILAEIGFNARKISD